MQRKNIVKMAVLVAVLAALTGYGIQTNAYSDFVKVTGIGNPGSGLGRLYVDSVTNQVACLNSDGSSCAPTGGGGCTAGTWTALTFQNGWQNFTGGSGFQVGEYSKDCTGRVWVRGLLSTPFGPNNTVAFTLPTGFRPFSTVLVVASFNQNEVPGKLEGWEVKTDGTFTYHGEGGYVSLDGVVSFSTAP